MSILNRLPGLQAQQRWKQVLAALYYTLVVLMFLSGLSEGGAQGLAAGVVYAVLLLLPAAVYAKRRALPLVGGSTGGQKALGWLLVLLAWSGLWSVGFSLLDSGRPLERAAYDVGRLSGTTAGLLESGQGGAQPGGQPPAQVVSEQAPGIAGEPTARPAATSTPAEPTPTPTAEFASRQAPVPADKAFVLAGRDDGWRLELGVARALIGSEATDFLQDVNMFNSPPTSGNQYVLLNLYAAIEGDDVPREFTKYAEDDWTLVAGGRPFEPPWFPGVVMPEPPFEGEVLPPGQLSGWVIFEVPHTDDLLLVFRRGKQPNGDWWFALQ